MTAAGSTASLIFTRTPPDKAISIEVAETADIAAVSSREDYCVGEVVDFSLQGSPPWTVAYD